MGIFIVLIGLCACGAVLKENYRTEDIGCILFWLSIIVLAIYLLICIVVNSSILDTDRDIVKYEKAVLEYRIEDQMNIHDNSKLLYDDVFLYKDILEFNEKVVREKTNRSSFWTGWAAPSYWTDSEIDIVEIPNLDYSIESE